jgi:hypothetical protein
MRRFLYEWIKYSVICGVIFAFFCSSFKSLSEPYIHCGFSYKSNDSILYQDFYYVFRQVYLLVSLYFFASCAPIVYILYLLNFQFSILQILHESIPIPTIFYVISSLKWGGIIVGISRTADALNRRKWRVIGHLV